MSTCVYMSVHTHAHDIMVTPQVPSSQECCCLKPLCRKAGPSSPRPAGADMSLSRVNANPGIHFVVIKAGAKNTDSHFQIFWASAQR